MTQTPPTTDARFTFNTPPPPSEPSTRGPRVRRRFDAWTFAVFACAALLILFAGWPVIRTVNIEIGDFAANSLLIQDAKSFALWKGNYSRIGFNHPGPAILYVLAAGEVVFHDWLHLVRSPFSGQLIAVALYNAFWIAVVARLLEVATGSRRSALVATAAFCFAATLIDHDVVGGAWFPHLYFFPFAVLLVAAARTVDGATDALPILATSAGFLVDGHVSFVVIVSLIVAVVVAGNYVRFRQGPLDRRILGRAYLRANARRLAAAFGIFAIFLVPLLVETLRAWPGPVAGYLGYGSSQPPQKLIDVLVFVGVYWGGLAPAVGAVATLAYLLRDDRPSPAMRDHLRSIATIAAAATFAMFVYGMYGVDDLKYRYVGLFYYAVPALIIAVTAMVAIEVPAWSALRAKVASLMIVACIAGTYAEISQRPFYVEQYNVPDAETLYRGLMSASGGRRMVLDLDTRSGFDYLWTHLVGAEAYAKRRGDVPFCIRRNWHILFTVAARCRADEVATAPRYAVRTSEAPVGDGAAPAFTSAGLRFFRLTTPDLSDAGVLTLAANPAVFADHLLDDGWSVGEGEHVWTIASTAHVAVPLRAGFRGTVTMDVDSFLPHDNSTQMVTVLVDGVVARTIAFSRAHSRQKIEVPAIPRPGASAVDIEFRIHSPISPKRAGISADPRLLGVSLYGLEIRKD